MLTNSTPSLLKSLATVALLGLATESLRADVLIGYDGSANGYTSSTGLNFARTASFSSGDGTPGNPYTYTNAFSDTVALSPSSDYSGPTFYGGYFLSSTTLQGGFSRQQIRESGGSELIYLQAYRADGWAGSTLAHGGVFIFKQADFNSGFQSGAVALDGLSVKFSSFGSATGRFTVQVGGDYYVSQSTVSVTSTSVQSLSGTALTSELWAAYDPSTNLVFDVGVASFATLDLSSVTAVGLYFHRDNLAGGSGATPYGFGIESFQATGTAAIPEPAQSAALAGIATLTALGLRRRASRTQVN